MLAAFVALTIGSGFLNPQSALAGEADAAFTERNKPHHTRPQKQGFFSSKSMNNGSGSGKENDFNDDGDDDIPNLKCPKPESLEQTEKRVFDMDKQIKKLEEVTDSDSETEKEKSEDKSPKKFNVDFDFELDKNGKPLLIVPMRDGSIRRVAFDQTRDKYYHEDLFPDITTPDGFDNKAVRKLEYSDRLAYLRENIPDESVIELQNEIAKSLIHPKTVPVPGFLGKYKIKDTLDINTDLGIVSFTDDKTNKHRTIVQMSPEHIKKLVKDRFHIFPDK